MKFWKVVKFTLVALSCVMLVSAFAGSGVVTVQAEEYYFTLHATVTANPYYGYYGGYHAVWAAIQNACAQIGINIEINEYSEFDWWDRVWETGWDKPWEGGGWDLFINEWWMMPTGLFRMEPLVYSWLAPPEGYNIFPWLDETADELLWKGMHTFDAMERKIYLWLWQEEFMHNPPMANLYYPRVPEITAAWLEGWDPIVRFRDISHLTLNSSMLAEARPDRDPNTLIYAVSDPLWSLIPLFMETYTEQWMCDLLYETLYDLSVDPWPPTGQEPSPTDFYSKPVLAAAPPVFMEGPNGPNTRARVLLRDDVYWSNGVKFNATDVKFTFDLILNPATKAVSRGKLLHLVESVEIVNKTCVDFILYAPYYADLAPLLSDDWGLAIIPYLPIKDYRPAYLKYSIPNTNFHDPLVWLPGTGPFKAIECDLDNRIVFEKNPYYFGYDLGWGPYNVTKVILQWMPNPLERMGALISHDVDFGEYTMSGLFKPICCYPYLRVWQYDYPASNPVWFNLNNQFLSNRYVRQAICHAIPYDYIINEILPDWDIETAYRGKTYILPHHYYTDESNVTVHLFNDDLQPYEYNITKAQKYMEMWYYSKAWTDYKKGPVGDADFSGFVDLDDFYIWRKWAGRVGPPPSLPGQDEDPDFDNNGYIDMYDFYKWREHWAFYYPEASTKQEWSR